MSSTWLSMRFSCSFTQSRCAAESSFSFSGFDGKESIVATFFGAPTLLGGS